ncbi:hypothetical protein BJV82DRAFT_581731 [Fennellomyces sp. T-0311]|nr:hypothetical protein BJV82DRAFT_581731 [Fennellomyces sp. T-0311]
MATAGTRNFGGLLTTRLLLGVMESGIIFRYGIQDLIFGNDQGAAEDHTWSWEQVTSVFTDVKAYLYALNMLFSIISSMGVSLALPSIIVGLGEWSNSVSIALTAPPYIAACFFIYIGCWSSASVKYVVLAIKLACSGLTRRAIAGAFIQSFGSIGAAIVIHQNRTETCWLHTLAERSSPKALRLMMHVCPENLGNEYPVNRAITLGYQMLNNFR